MNAREWIDWIESMPEGVKVMFSKESLMEIVGEIRAGAIAGADERFRADILKRRTHSRLKGKRLVADEETPETGGVYVIHVEGTDIYKIGRSGNLRSRIGGLCHACPLPVTVVALWDEMDLGAPTEEELHERFASNRMHGEWFRGCPELLELIEACKTL